MIALSTSTAAAIALHAAEGSWVVFLQVAPLPGQQSGPIKIEGMRGTQLAPRLAAIARDSPYEVQLIGLMPTPTPIEDAIALGQDHPVIHDNWYEPTGDLLALIQHAGQEAMRSLLAETHPGGLEGQDIVDIEGIAAVLNVSVPTVRRLIKAEEIPFMRFGRIYRFSTEDVLASLQRR